MLFSAFLSMHSCSPHYCGISTSLKHFFSHPLRKSRTAFNPLLLMGSPSLVRMDASVCSWESQLRELPKEPASCLGSAMFSGRCLLVSPLDVREVLMSPSLWAGAHGSAPWGSPGLGMLSILCLGPSPQLIVPSVEKNGCTWEGLSPHVLCPQ